MPRPRTPLRFAHRALTSAIGLAAATAGPCDAPTVAPEPTPPAHPPVTADPDRTEVPTLRPVDQAILQHPRRAALTARITVIVIVIVIVAVGGAAVWVAGMASYVNHDPIDLLDLPETVDTADAACAGVLDTLSDPAASRRDRITAGNAAIDRLVEAMEGLGADTLDADLPSRAWIEDWTTLAAAREDLGAALDSGQDATFVVPQTEDGYPITTRMSDAATTTCATAVALASSP